MIENLALQESERALEKRWSSVDRRAQRGIEKAGDFA